MKKNVFPREIWLANLKENSNANGMLLVESHPVLVLNDYKTLGKQDLIQIVPITSNMERLLRSHLELNGYGLDKYSKALFEQIQTIHRDQLIKRLGKIEDVETNKKIDVMIKKVILVDSESKLNLDNVINIFNKQLKEKVDIEKLNLNVKYIRQYYFNKDYESTMLVAQMLMNQLKESNLDRTIKNDFTWYYWHTKSLVSYALRDINASVECTEQALKYINKNDAKHHYATSIWHLGNLREEQGNLHEARIIFINLSKYFKNYNKIKERYVCVFNIAFVQRNFKRMNQIINMIEESKDNKWFNETDKNFVLQDLKNEVARLRNKLI